MDIFPESISRDGDSAVLIRWTDGQTTRWTARELRDACPCATCREKSGSLQSADLQSGSAGDSRSDHTPTMSLPVLSAAEAKPLSITSMRPVGSYAYNIGFSDGHSSGLFLLESLRDLGNADQSRGSGN